MPPTVPGQRTVLVPWACRREAHRSRSGTRNREFGPERIVVRDMPGGLGKGTITLQLGNEVKAAAVGAGEGEHGTFLLAPGEPGDLIVVMRRTRLVENRPPQPRELRRGG